MVQCGGIPSKPGVHFVGALFHVAGRQGKGDRYIFDFKLPAMFRSHRVVPGGMVFRLTSRGVGGLLTEVSCGCGARRRLALARLSGFEPLDNFFRFVSSEFPR
jgi:hypothetical protein